MRNKNFKKPRSIGDKFGLDYYVSEKNEAVINVYRYDVKKAKQLIKWLERYVQWANRL